MLIPRSLKLLTAILLLTALALIGCDSGGAGSGGGAAADFDIGETDAQPAELYVIKALDDEQSGARIFQLYLTNGEPTVDRFGPSGSGDVVNLKLLVDGDTLAAGTYQYDGTSPTAGDLTGLTVYVDYDFQTNEGDTHFITGGSVAVGRPNGEYSVDFDLETDTGSIAGSFSGPAAAVLDLQQQ